MKLPTFNAAESRAYRIANALSELLAFFDINDSGELCFDTGEILAPVSEEIADAYQAAQELLEEEYGEDFPEDYEV